MRKHANDPDALFWEVHDVEGELVPFVLEVDTEEGWADVYVLDCEGKFEADAAGNLVVTRLTGTFTLQMKEQ